MADLDFKHNVQQIPAGEALPESKRTVTAEVSRVPDFQGAASQYAQNTNWMSAIGSEVAARASNAIASKMGGELGKNPKGDLTPSLTDFDKAFAESYKTQAQATLGLQANKLITDSNLAMASAPRISPDMIASTNKQISLGLQNIFKNAPAEIVPQLESHYGSLAMSQTADLTHRMIREQREDQRQTTIASSSVNAQNAYALGMSGNEKAGLELVKTTERLNESAYNDRVIDQSAKKTHVDTVRQSFKTGLLIHSYEQQRAAGKGEEFLKSVADKSDTTDPDYMATTNGLMQYVNHQTAIRSQDEQLRVVKFNESLALNPVSPDMQMQLQDLKDNVSPIAYQKAELAYIQARKAFEQNGMAQQDLVSGWADSAVHARATPKQVNKTFDALVNSSMQKDGISRDDAENQVAISAGAPVPVFIDTVTKKLTSGNPASIVSAANQMQNIRAAEGGHALIGVSKTAQAIAIQFQHQRGSMPDSDLARKITDNLVNIDSSMQTTLDNQWNLKLSAGGAGGLGASKSLASFALAKVGINDEDKFGGAYFKTIYGNDIYDQLRSNFDAARGDMDTAVQMTKDYVDQHYGETRVNGGIHISDSPIEKVLGYSDPDVVPIIQQDLLNQLNVSFEKHKNEADDWSISPINTDKATGGRSTFRKQFPPAEIIRKVKTDKGMKEFRYPVNLIGRPGGSWDVVVQTPSGPRNLFLVAPSLGVITYKPNEVEIRKNYKEHVDKKGWF